MNSVKLGCIVVICKSVAIFEERFIGIRCMNVICVGLIIGYIGVVICTLLVLGIFLECFVCDIEELGYLYTVVQCDRSCSKWLTLEA